MDKSSSQYISHEAFLLTDLRYTLGQLRAQLTDLSPQERSVEVDGQSIDRILQRMNDDEVRFQDEYRRILSVVAWDGEINGSSLEESFETRRRQTIELLASAGEPWPSDLLQTVQHQIHGDRQHTTAIARCHIGMPGT